MGLKAKFNLGMLAAFVVGLALAAAFLWRTTQTDAQRGVTQEATVMLGQASAIATYTDRQIAPLLADQLKTRFLPQTIPFFAAKTNFRALEKLFPNYSFSEAALNPTNPADRATDWQADMIGAFARDPKLTSLQVVRNTPVGPILSVARPVRVSSASCLACHSTPAAAPPAMVDLYGPSNGFGWHLGQTVGAEIVSVPMQVALERAHRSFAVFVGGIALVFLLMLVLLNVLMQVVVVRRIRRMSAIAGEVSLGNADAPEFAARGRDEIASLAASFNRMRRSLDNALRLLDR